jgi:hypothetical protein
MVVGRLVAPGRRHARVLLDDRRWAEVQPNRAAVAVDDGATALFKYHERPLYPNRRTKLEV